MSGTYTIKVISDFASAHSLRDYPGDCKRLHGHNWKVEAEVRAAQLDELGMVIDFKTVRGITRGITDELDHRYLNEIPPFDTINPTAENIAAYIYQRLNQALDDPRVSVVAITLWETERACVRYAEEV